MLVKCQYERVASARYRRDLTLFWISMHLTILNSDFNNFVINKWLWMEKYSLSKSLRITLLLKSYMYVDGRLLLLSLLLFILFFYSITKCFICVFS